MLQASYARGTKDSDVLETVDLDADIRVRLEAKVLTRIIRQSIMNLGRRLRARHLFMIMGRLGQMVPGCTFTASAEP